MKLKFCSVLLLVCLHAASAAAAICGNYLEKATGMRLELRQDGTAREFKKDGLLNAFNLYYQKDSILNLRNSENGLGERYRVSKDGSNLTLIDTKWGDRSFEALQKNNCVSLAEMSYLEKPVCDYGKEVDCCSAGDRGACVRSASDKGDVAQLQQYCASRPDACLGLLESYLKSAAPFTGQLNLYAEKKSLFADQLQELVASCEKHMTPELCQKTVEQLWRAQKFVQSGNLLKKMCDAQIEEYACARYKELNNAGLTEKPNKATSLPCGVYKSAVSVLISELIFTDRGIVSFGVDGKQRARLEDGLVKIRHDKGGDFIFARQGNDILLGLDSWNQFGVYRRQGFPEKGCQPAVTFIEQPLSTGCGIDKNPLDCCTAGDTEGCNRLGNMAALGNDWKGAAMQYEKVCGKGVRIGCENWVYTVGKTGDEEGVENGLKQLCKNDSRHVACDLLELNSIQKSMLLFGLEQVMKGARDDK